jgi:hypothetical protein
MAGMGAIGKSIGWLWRCALLLRVPFGLTSCGLSSINHQLPLSLQETVEDKPKSTEEDFFHRLHLIFRRSLADESY